MKRMRVERAMKDGVKEGRKSGGTDVQFGRCRRWVTSEVSGVSGSRKRKGWEVSEVKD